jgi:hypothetical protein
VLKFKDPVSEQIFSGNDLVCHAEVGLGDKNQNKLALDRLQYELQEGDKARLSNGMERKPDTKSEYKVEAINYMLKRKQGRVWYPGAPVVIETHSEHFLRRLQRRIAEDAVPQKKVSAYFANIAKTPAKLEPLQIDIFGNIMNWPENFFGDEMGEIAEQAKAARKKRMQKTEKPARLNESAEEMSGGYE